MLNNGYKYKLWILCLFKSQFYTIYNILFDYTKHFNLSKKPVLVI